VPLVGVDAADDDIVLQDCLSGNIASDGPGSPVTAADARKTYNAPGRDLLNGVGDDRSGTCAFDDDIWASSIPYCPADLPGVRRSDTVQYPFRCRWRLQIPLTSDWPSLES